MQKLIPLSGLMSTFPFIAAAKREDYINLHFAACEERVPDNSQRLLRGIDGNFLDNVQGGKSQDGLQEEEKAIVCFHYSTWKQHSPGVKAGPAPFGVGREIWGPGLCGV